MSPLGRIPALRRSGKESFHEGQRSLGFDLLDFWQWSASDLVSNVQRGVLAEYLVSRALGLATDGVREEWAPWDLQLPDGTRIEVKSAAYLQSWRQRHPSRIGFGIAKTRAWSDESGWEEGPPRRQADLYVFALLAHAEQETLDPLDVSQWTFHVVPTSLLDRNKGNQERIALSAVEELSGGGVPYDGLPGAVAGAARQMQAFIRT